MSDIFAESSVEDASPLIVKNVLLCGNDSRNGYAIPPEAFVDEAHVKRLYDGVQVFLNHRRERAVEDLAGTIRNPRFVNGKPYGDIDTEGFPGGPLLLNLARKQVKRVGMSHVAQYTKTGNRVQRVNQVQSVDLVINPATTNTCFENTMDPSALDLLKEKVTSLESTIVAANKKNDELTKQVTDLQAEATKSQATIASLTQEKTQLTTELDGHKARLSLEARRQEAVTDLQEAFKEGIAARTVDLNDKAVFSDVFMEQLIAAPTKEVRSALIADRKAIVSNSSRPAGSFSSERAGEQPWSAKSLLSSPNLFSR